MITGLTMTPPRSHLSLDTPSSICKAEIDQDGLMQRMI